MQAALKKASTMNAGNFSTLLKSTIQVCHLLVSRLLWASALVSAALVVSQTATAAMSSSDIKSTVDQFMQQHIARLSSSYGDTVRIEFQIKSLDPRLSLADCGAPLDTELTSQNSIGRVNIKVSCLQQQRWSIYVPVEIDLFRPVVATVLPVARGEQLTAGHLELREMNISNINGSYFVDPAEVIGMQAKRVLSADQAVVAQYIELPVVVKKGESVLMTAQTSGLVVKIPAIALSDGRIGQQISVRNKQSKRVVEARVSAPGQVTVTM
jgi:flagella basal body P-ring formation protein FlgA